MQKSRASSTQQSPPRERTYPSSDYSGRPDDLPVPKISKGLKSTIKTHMFAEAPEQGVNYSECPSPACPTQTKGAAQNGYTEWGLKKGTLGSGTYNVRYLCDQRARILMLPQCSVCDKAWVLPKLKLADEFIEMVESIRAVEVAEWRESQPNPDEAQQDGIATSSVAPAKPAMEDGADATAIISSAPGPSAALAASTPTKAAAGAPFTLPNLSLSPLSPVTPSPPDRRPDRKSALVRSILFMPHSTAHSLSDAVSDAFPRHRCATLPTPNGQSRGGSRRRRTSFWRYQAGRGVRQRTLLGLLHHRIRQCQSHLLGLHHHTLTLLVTGIEV